VTDNLDEDLVPPGGRPSPRLGWSIAALLALLVVVAAVVLVVEYAVLRPHYRDAKAAQTDRADVVRVSERFATEVNNYSTANIGSYQSTITPMLSPKFAGEFQKAMTDIVTEVKQAKMTSKGTVVTAGISSLDPDSAQVLVVSDASVKTVYGIRARHFRWQVTLVKLGGRWLVDDFTPIQ